MCEGGFSSSDLNLVICDDNCVKREKSAWMECRPIASRQLEFCG